MGNIVGEDHLQYVKTQIKDRQQILGKNNKSNEDIVWANNKGGWCRLMSSIDIADQDVIRFDPDTNKTELVSNSGSEFRNQYLDLQDYSGPMLAQELILQGGILNYDEPRFGVSDISSNLPGENYNYGYGGTEFGLNAMPGLLEFTSKTYDNGSLRKATIKIKANNKKQFEYLESTYIRLGYTMLLEWGNTTFPLQETNDEGTSFTRYATTGDNAALSLKDEFINSYNKGQNYFHTRIEELRKESQGNYDGFLGTVDNFDWEFQKDGSYLITLSLITIGSVIQSLKGNVSLPSVRYPSVDGSKFSKPEEDRPSALEVAIDLLSQCEKVESSVEVDSTIINKILSYIKAISPSTSPGGISNIQFTQELLPIKSNLSLEEEALLGISNNDINPNSNIISCCAAFGQDAFSVQYYLRLGTLLEFINKKLLLYDQDLNPSHITIDTSIDTYCYSNSWSFPADPEKMMISFSKTSNQQNLSVFAEPGTQIDKFHTTRTLNSTPTKVGQVMNLYFNRDYLKSLIKQYTDDTNGLSIYKFIEALLNTANSQLGNVNKLKLRITNQTFTETEFSQEGEAQYRGFDGTGEGDVAGTNKIAVSNSTLSTAVITTKIVTKQVLQIYDEVTFTESITNPNFVVYGLNPSSGEINTENFIEQEGSFITDVTLKTNIDKNLSSMIAIGAQAGGRAVGYDSMVFSKWNVGLTDRVIPSKLDIDKAKREGLDSRNDWTKLLQTYKSYLSNLSGASITTIQSDSAKNLAERYFSLTLDSVYTGYVIPNVFLSGNKDEKPSFSRFQTVQSNFFNKVLAWDAERKNTVTPFQGFLPINLSLTMDGLSGIRIFDKITVDSRFLPKNYTDTLNFIITELDHRFENNKWVTSIGTLSIPKLFPDNKVTISTESSINTPTTPTEVPEVQAEDIIEEELETTEELPRTTPKQSPSYFIIKPSVWRGVSINGIRPLRKSKRIERDGIDEILDLLNASPYVQQKFKSFFLQILDTYPTGYAFTINDATRYLGQKTSTVGMGSAHQYGLAIDLGIREAAPEDQKDPPITKKLFGSERTLANVNAIRKFGLPTIAYKNDITWGGDYTKGYVYDVVHFAVAPKWSSFSGSIRSNLYLRLANLKPLLAQAKISTPVQTLLKFVDTKDFVLLKMENGKPKYTTNVKRVFFGGNTAQVRINKKELGYNE
jgi:hypothetical protein